MHHPLRYCYAKHLIVIIMGLIREPVGVDFIVDSRPLTDDEELAISEFIRTDKEKRRHRELQKRTISKKIGHEQKY